MLVWCTWICRTSSAKLNAMSDFHRAQFCHWPIQRFLFFRPYPFFQNFIKNSSTIFGPGYKLSSSTWIWMLNLIATNSRVTLHPSVEFHQDPFITCWHTRKCRFIPRLLMVTIESLIVIHNPQKNPDLYQNAITLFLGHPQPLRKIQQNPFIICWVKETNPNESYITFLLQWR